MFSTLEAPTNTLEADYTSHTAALVKRGVYFALRPSSLAMVLIPGIGSQFAVNTIPAYYFYFFRDFLVAGSLMYAAYYYIPKIEIPLARYVTGAVYGYIQGQQMTGIWVREVSPVSNQENSDKSR